MLELDSVTFGYGSKEIIKNVSFMANEGDFLGIIGPNGAGKTTLFRLITGLLKPWRGTALFQGEDILSIPRNRFARQSACMMQAVELSFPFSVEEFVLMGRFPHRKKWQPLTKHDREVIEQALALTNTISLRERLLNGLSGGEKQRVMLAQALAQEPKLLLLDEPTSHLDIGHQIEILDLVRKLNRENNLTVIMVIHDLNLAGEYCENLILIDEGKIHSRGTPGEVLTYENIEKVYKTVVVVKQNPFSSKPYIILVPKEYIEPPPSKLGGI